MKPIDIDEVQSKLDGFVNKPVYVHVETTNGAYASHFNNKGHNVGAYVRNANVTFTQAKIVGEENLFRAGLKLEKGWIYAEGLTDFTMHNGESLLLAGHDQAGRIMVSLQISEHPFEY